MGSHEARTGIDDAGKIVRRPEMFVPIHAVAESRMAYSWRLRGGDLGLGRHLLEAVARASDRTLLQMGVRVMGLWYSPRGVGRRRP